MSQREKMMQKREGKRLLIAILATGSLASQTFADQERIDFKCTFDAHCSSLNETSCFEPGAGILLSHETENGVSIVMYNEVWASQVVDFQTARDDLTTVAFGAPSGEVAMLTTDGNWNFSLTIHFTGTGNRLNWESGTGHCKMMET